MYILRRDLSKRKSKNYCKNPHYAFQSTGNYFSFVSRQLLSIILLLCNSIKMTRILEDEMMKNADS